MNVARKEGRPLTDEERRKRSFKHLMHYGIKMMVRRDIGGKDAIENHAEKIRDEMLTLDDNILDAETFAYDFVGKTAKEASEIVVKRLGPFIRKAAALTALKQQQQSNGIKERQRRTTIEIERRLENLETIFTQVLIKTVADQKATDVKAEGNALRRSAHGVLPPALELQDTLHILTKAVGEFIGGEKDQDPANHVLN